MTLNKLRRLAFVGNSLPRRCGIATFTTDLEQAIAAVRPELTTNIVAMTDHDRSYDYPAVVTCQVHDDQLEDYERAADLLNASGIQLVSLQHEFGIFGGEAGSHVMALLTRLHMPIVTTLHTVLSKPSSVQRAVLGEIMAVSATVVVMAQKGRDLLQTVYGVPADKIEVIPHGVPDLALTEPADAKLKLGFDGKAVILTFGLLSPNKGIEVMIDALPAILKRRPDAIYVVLGATHPNLVRSEGEAYRQRLQARARQLGVAEHVVFLDRFVDQATLLDFISMCDVYVTPYLHEAQMTSGTLAYSFGLGKAVVSTPYWHARELLADGHGILVPFGDAAAIGREIAELLTNDARRQAMRDRAYQSSRAMTWQRTAERYLDLFKRVAGTGRHLTVVEPSDSKARQSSAHALVNTQLGHFLSMCDDTGLFQHAVHSVPDRTHGYCVDDNARALLLTLALNDVGEPCLPDALSARLAAFIQNAWNPTTRRFRNFMSFDRRWLEDTGSEDSHGRTLWSLGQDARNDASPSRRRWAAALFMTALPVVVSFHSPRAWAFTLLGLDGYLTAVGPEPSVDRLRHVLAGRLAALLAAAETVDWIWFEDGLAYDNARLCQALIVTGLATGTADYLDAGLRSLRWLVSLQTTPAGLFRPVGSASFGEQRTLPRQFDQQPLEATATISACLAAWRVDGADHWRHEADRAFTWFFGANDLHQSLVDLDTGSCCDGLHPDRLNQNRGGESVISYLLSQAEMRQLARQSDDQPKSLLQVLGA